jgi:hypothetical protein
LRARQEGFQLLEAAWQDAKADEDRCTSRRATSGAEAWQRHAAQDARKPDDVAHRPQSGRSVVLDGRLR